MVSRSHLQTLLQMAFDRRIVHDLDYSARGEILYWHYVRMIERLSNRLSHHG